MIELVKCTARVKACEDCEHRVVKLHYALVDKADIILCFPAEYNERGERLWETPYCG